MSLPDMKIRLEHALDDLISPRSTLAVQGQALSALEEVVAELLLNGSTSTEKYSIDRFFRLQDTFQCNIASRVLVWLSRQTEVLKRGHSSDEEDFQVITGQVMLSLSLLQGAAFIHRGSKIYLSRKYPIDVLLDLLSASRHAVAKPLANSTNTVQNGGQTNGSRRGQKYPPSLASVTLDTLLCVLVDMPEAIRTFEECNGLELIVKTLKRASISRDVRMKCLEFLYFYLMDETPSSSVSKGVEAQTRTSSPVKTAQSSVTDTEAVQYNTPDQATSRSISFRHKSNPTFSSFSSWSPTPTLAKTPPQSPTKGSNSNVLKPSLSAPPLSLSSSRHHQESPEETSHERGPLAMLRSDVDFVPLSPKKAQISKLGVGMAGNRRTPGGPGTPPRFPLKQQMSLGGLDNVGGAGSPAPRQFQQRRPSPLSCASTEATLPLSDGDEGFDEQGGQQPEQKMQSPTKAATGADDDHRLESQLSALDPARTHYDGRKGIEARTRTIEEKKEILGQLLGNVDALVEGIRKAGIWGLAG